MALRSSRRSGGFGLVGGEIVHSSPVFSRRQRRDRRGWAAVLAVAGVLELVAAFFGVVALFVVAGLLFAGAGYLLDSSARVRHRRWGTAELGPALPAATSTVRRVRDAWYHAPESVRGIVETIEDELVVRLDCIAHAVWVSAGDDSALVEELAAGLADLVRFVPSSHDALT